MRYSEAYSLDLGRAVSAEEACLQYGRGLISSPTAFRCASSGCNAPLRCVNLERPQNERKREPHFRTEGKTELHDLAKCTYHVESAHVSTNYTPHERDFQNREKDLSPDVVFLLATPAHPPRRSNAPNDPVVNDNKRRSLVGRSDIPRSPNPTRLFRLRDLARKYENLTHSERMNRHVRIGAERRSWQDLFFSLDRPNKNLSNYKPYVFFGMGYIDVLRNSNVRLCFSYKQILSGQRGQVRLFFSLADAEQYDERNLLLSDINSGLTTHNGKIALYVYGLPRFQKGIGDLDFLEIECQSLDHVYFYPKNYRSIP